MQIYKVNALPGVLAANAMYIVPQGADSARIWITNSTATKARDVTALVDTAFARYDLSVGTSTGAMDLNTAQVFSIDNTTSGTRALSITNPPAAGRSMTVVAVVNGATGTVSFPAGAHVAEGAGTELGAVSTIFVMLVVGNNVTVTTNLRVNT